MTDFPTNGSLFPRAKRLLLADTDPGLCWSLDKGLQLSGYEVRVAKMPKGLLDPAALLWADCVLMELIPEAGIHFNTLSDVLALARTTPVVCTSIDPMPEVVIECMRQGATDFLAKPFGLAEVRRVLGGVFDRIAPTQVAESDKTPTSSSPLVGVSPAMQELRKFIQQVAQTSLNCLIRGESGVGKDVVAQEIHRLSSRNDKPFVKVNCTALPESLLESELFGYEKGAFTGASTAKPGRFSLANEGVIFLDEIGDMHGGLQAKILQVIEHKEFTPVGSAQTKRVDVQIIAATNVDLEEKASKGEFRKDLYFRLNEIGIWVPPLRERREDVPFLVRHFLQKHEKNAVAESLHISGEELEELSKHDWPGNVREMENMIKRWLVLGKQMPQSGLFTRSHANPKPQRKQPAALLPSKPEEGEPGREEICAALEKFQWNRKKAAESLGMGYQALRRRIDRYDLTKRQ
jgi:two-component system, NtrC family, response regulator AtoC